MEKSGPIKPLLYPWVTIFSGIILVGINIGFIFSAEWFYSFCSLMEYDRFLILKGEAWRLLTGHLVHWSPAHFYLDSIVFLFQGVTFEKKIGRRYWLLMLLSTLFIGLTLLFFRRDLLYYRGISGLINTQLVLGSGLYIMDRSLDRVTRGLFSVCFSIHMIKIAYETVKRVPFFSTHLLGDMGLFTPVAHLSGVVLGFMFLAVYLMLFSGKSELPDAVAAER